MPTPFDTAPIILTDPGVTENPLSDGGQWTFISGVALQRVSAGYIATEPGGAVGIMLWNPQFWQDASICWVYDNNPATAGYIGLALRATPDGNTCYIGVWDKSGGPSWTIYKIVAGVQTSIGTSVSTQAFLAGDRIGFSVIGSALGLWYQSRAGVATPSPLNTNWTQIVSCTDTAITAAGYMMLKLGGLETSVSGSRGGALFPVGGTGSGSSGATGPQNPTFDTRVRTITTRP